jgi:hypothetical protein
MDACNVITYSFTNLCAHHAPELKLKDVDTDWVLSNLDGYEKVVALGGLAAKFCERNGISHRKFNDKSFEPGFINTLKEYLNV